MRVEMKATIERRSSKVTKRLMRKIYMPAVIETAKDVQAHYKEIQKNFSAKNRSKIRRKSNSGVPPFHINSSYAVWSVVGTDDYKPLLWLESGTSKRYRLMSPGWQSKTWPGSGLRFRSGHGKAGGFDMNEAAARQRRILPRLFRGAIIEDVYPKFSQRIDEKTTELWRHLDR